MNLSVYIFIGPPGCGKGTQAKLLASYSFYQISTGDLLRSNLMEDTDLSRELKKILGSGQLVNDDIVFELLKKKLNEMPENTSVILDGFPRTLFQAKMLDTLNINNKTVLNFKIPAEVLLKRIEGRFSCKSCDALYNDFTKPLKEEGVCDVCGGNDFLRRLDDSIDVLKKRLEAYDKETRLLENYYSDIIDIDASLSVDDLHKEVCRILNLQKVD